MKIKEGSIWFETVPDKLHFNSLKKDISVDVAVIGGGIVGVSSAFMLKKKGLKVALLEKNHIATGNSGYSTAFLTRVPDVLSYKLYRKYGDIFLKRVFEAAGNAQKELFRIIKDNRIKCDFMNCNSYFLSYKRDKKLEDEWDVTKKVDSNAEFIKYNNRLGIKFYNAIKFRNEGKFDVRKYILELIKKSDIDVFEETEVISIKHENKFLIKTKNGNVKADKIIVGSGEPSELLPDLNLVRPVITYVFAVESDILSNDLFWDTLKPYYYYRKINDKITLIGGCDSINFNNNSYKKLIKFVLGHFGKVKIRNRWSGTVYKTKDGLPYIFEHPKLKNIFIATGFDGNGMVFGTLAAMMMCDFVMNKKNKYRDLFSLKRA